MKKLAFIFCVFLCVDTLFAANERQDVTGYWTMYDLGKKKSGLVYVYEYQGKIYGRTLVTCLESKSGELMVETYDNPKSRAPYLEGHPFTTGLDIIWDLQWDARRGKYVKGYILDPRKKSPYRVDLWREGDILKVFGNIGAGIGATVYWKRASVSDLPNGVPAPKLPLEPKIYPKLKN